MASLVRHWSATAAQFHSLKLVIKNKAQVCVCAVGCDLACTLPLGAASFATAFLLSFVFVFPSNGIALVLFFFAIIVCAFVRVV